MSSSKLSQSTIFLDSGAQTGVTLYNDSFGLPTYANWQQSLSLPILIDNPDEYVMALSAATYRTPYGPIPNTLTGKGKGFPATKALKLSTIPESRCETPISQDDFDIHAFDKYRETLATNENGTSSVYVYMSIAGPSAVGDESQKVIGVIPPANVITTAGYTNTDTLLFIPPGTNIPVVPGSWPVNYVSESTVTPWVPIGQGSFNLINVTFASSAGTIIPTADLARPAPFKLVLVIKRKTDL